VTSFFIGFAFFEFGALCGFFVAALMQAARDGDEKAEDFLLKKYKDFVRSKATL
jgi:hypothetical protein